MEPINGWNELEEAGSFEKIELGGHICAIVGARTEVSKSGNKMLVIAYDFAPEDKQPGYYVQCLQRIERKTRMQSGEVHIIRGMEQNSQIHISKLSSTGYWNLILDTYGLGMKEA